MGEDISLDGDRPPPDRLEALETRLRDSELRLHELQHRIRNTLETMISLLHAQAQDAPPEARKALIAAEGRLMAVAGLYDRLVEHDDAKTIDLALHMERVLNLQEAIRPDHVTMVYRRGVDSCLVPAPAAINLLLIVNELVTNAMQHAFPDGRDGEIVVGFNREEDGFCLTVIDNGIGTAWSDQSFGFGLRIASRLIERLGGRIAHIAQDSGTHIEVRFAAVQA